VRPNLAFAELDGDIGVLGIIKERSREVIYKCHDEVFRAECAVPSMNYGAL